MNSVQMLMHVSLLVEALSTVGHGAFEGLFVAVDAEVSVELGETLEHFAATRTRFGEEVQCHAWEPALLNKGPQSVVHVLLLILALIFC